MEGRSQDLKVFITTGEAKCNECCEELGRKAWITVAEDRSARCLACADLDHLVFLPAGDATLTRRARKHTTLSAIVLKWSRSRKRYERQGVLVEETALNRAEEKCLTDADLRARRRERARERRDLLDRQHLVRFAERVRELFPNCPSGVDQVIAEHACLKYSGRVGRSAEAKKLDERAVRNAVTARIRHSKTPYDELLASGMERDTARREVWEQVKTILHDWGGAT